MAKQFELDHQAAHQAATELLLTLDKIPIGNAQGRYQACLQTLLTFRATGTTITLAAAAARGEETPVPDELEPTKPNPSPLG